MAARFDPRVYRDPTPNRVLMRLLEPVSRGFLRHVLRVRTLELPAADLARLRAAVNPKTSAFLAPLHPEFLTDWLIDKEIAARVSPYMAHWAAYEIINSDSWSQAFWLSNNLIANVPGGEGREYSVRWALQGHGVLLHVEGTATWHGRHVGTLLPGAVEMARETARRARDSGSARRVFVAPLVWAMCFGRDVSRDLAREMAYLERGLALPSGDGLGGAARWGAIQRAVLARAFARFGEPVEPLESGRQFFEAQDALRGRLLERLERQHGSGDGDLRRRIRALRRAIREQTQEDRDAAREQRAMLGEIERLSGFTRECRGAATITQEEIAESLKCLRVWLLAKTLADRAHNTVPVPVTWRTMHIRVPEPIPIAADVADSEDAAQVGELRSRMQGTLDRLHLELAPRVDPYRQPNPLAV